MTKQIRDIFLFQGSSYALFNGMMQLAKGPDREIRRRYCEFWYDFKEFLDIHLTDGHVVNINHRSEDVE